MAIYITADLHGSNDIKKLSATLFPNQKELTKNDFVIILGDFGLIWSDEETKEETYWLDWLNSRNFTTLFIDGNHDNHNKLASFPVNEWHGGRVHFIRPSVIHLMRGQVFDIEELKFFTMGGARSHDIWDGILEVDDPRLKNWYKDPYKMFRVRNVDWWDAEMPSEAEFDEGIINLAKNDFKIDYILTHSPSMTEMTLMHYKEKSNPLMTYIDDIMTKTDFKRHYFGHMHIDKQISYNGICLYNKIERII